MYLWSTRYCDALWAGLSLLSDISLCHQLLCLLPCPFGWLIDCGKGYYSTTGMEVGPLIVRRTDVSSTLLYGWLLVGKTLFCRKRWKGVSNRPTCHAPDFRSSKNSIALTTRMKRISPSSSFNRHYRHQGDRRCAGSHDQIVAMSTINQVVPFAGGESTYTVYWLYLRRDRLDASNQSRRE
jgi:hypothetical protein